MKLFSLALLFFLMIAGLPMMAAPKLSLPVGIDPDSFFFYKTFCSFGHLPEGEVYFPRFDGDRGADVAVIPKWRKFQSFRDFRGSKLRVLSAPIVGESDFDVEILRDMPLEVLDLTSYQRPMKLSELAPLLVPPLKELYLERMEIDDWSLLSSLQLEALGLSDVIVANDFPEQLAKLKSLKRLQLGALYTRESGNVVDRIVPLKNFSTQPLMALPLDGVALEYFPGGGDWSFLTAPSLKYLRFPNVVPEELLKTIAGHHFAVLSFSRKFSPDELRKYKITADSILKY